MNKVILLGNLGGDPDVRYSGSSKTCIASFNLAVRRRYQREGRPESDWFKCTAFGKTGEFVEKYLKKGTKVIVEGEIQNDNYEDKNGVKHYENIVIVNSVEFAESKKSNKATEPGKVADDEGFVTVDEDSDDGIPFV